MKTRDSLTAMAAILLSVSTSTFAADEAQVSFPAEHVQFFKKDVLPLLQQKCFKCHGGRPKVEGSFRITSREGILSGGDAGPGAVAGKPSESEMISAINYESFEMPPTGKLSAEQIATLTKWVELGVPWSETEDYGVEELVEVDSRGDGSDYWAYQQIKSPDVPSVKNSHWVTNPIDAFVLSKLDAAGLTPVQKADKVTLLRRAYYDLIGLPPTPEEVDRFVADNSPQAFEKVLDHLLELPQYGQKWGRHWLDIVRFAETHGYERDSPKPFAWRYRDYVIESFNKDKPYDQFVIEQLAGDELPDVTMETLTATGFYRLGIWDDEPADRELARYDGLDDVMKTASEAVLGISMGCARCHSHKVDPINHDEYYSFLSYFHDVTHPNRENLRYWLTDADQSDHEQRVADKKRDEDKMVARIVEIEDQFKRGLREKSGISTEGDDVPENVGDKVVFADSRLQPQEWEYTFEKPSNDWLETDYSTTSWKKGPGGFGTAGTPKAVVRTQWATPDIWLRKWFEVETGPPFLAIELHHDEDCEIYINGKQVHTTKGYVTDYFRVVLSPDALKALQPGKNVIAIHCHQNGGGQYIDAGLVIAPGRFDIEVALKQYGGRVLGQELVKELRGLNKQLEVSRKKQLPPAGQPVMAVTESGRSEVHVLLRGNPQARGDRVDPGVPAMLRTQPPQIAAAQNGSSGKRLALARWMFNDDNPLTARVIANRIWQHHFGRGIVATPNDFGKLGDRPTHPELLDWLATEVRAGDWKLKRIHKLIMLSSTWQLASSGQEPNLTKDPANHLLWRSHMRRLSAEELRDSILAATGELNLKAGGPSVYVPIPLVVLQGQSQPGAGWGQSPPEEAARRSVYIHIKRSLLVPIMAMHDQADTDSSCPVRYVTTVPTQSLGMLNGEFTNEKAARLAERLQKATPDDLSRQIREAVRLTTGRTPDDDEVKRDLNFVKTLQGSEKLTVEQAMKMYCLLILNTNEFVYLD
jgi:hypothetical protein